MSIQSPPPWSSFLAIRYLPTWLAIALLYLTAWLPWTGRMMIGKLLGLATWHLARERRYITSINIAWCFPELSAQQQHSLVRQSFIENGKGLVESVTAWVRPPSHFRAMSVTHGLEHLEAALAQGKGVLLLGAHYSTLDFGTSILSVLYPFAVTYRAHRNPLFDNFMLRGRLRNCERVFDRRDIRGAFRHLRQGKILWYAPDQDYGPQHAVFAPFFGHEAATITSASRFAQSNNSAVVVLRQGRNDQSGKYELEFARLDPAFPSGDDLLDASMFNASLERFIRVQPAQYLWMHKRFKTQREGKPASPYILIRTPRNKLSDAQYAQLAQDSEPYFTSTDQAHYLRLHSGLALREFAGVPGRLMRSRHAAFRFDRVSKQLRNIGIRTITVDNLFLVPSRNLTAATCFLPAGRPLPEARVEPALAAAFLAQLHNAGFYFAVITPDILVADESGVGLLDPLQLQHVPGSASYRQRLDDLLRWSQLDCSGDFDFAALSSLYLALVRKTDVPGFRKLLAQHPGLAHNAPISSNPAVE